MYQIELDICEQSIAKTVQQNIVERDDERMKILFSTKTLILKTTARWHTISLKRMLIDLMLGNQVQYQDYELFPSYRTLSAEISYKNYLFNESQIK